MRLATAGKPAPHPRRSSDRWSPEDGDPETDEFRKQFGFRGVEYGNWVRLDERASYIGKLTSDLNALAAGLQIEPEIIGSIGHKRPLALGLGARGRNPHASGHYEPSTHCANLVRGGLGRAFTHEWGHAIDYTVGEGKFWSHGPLWQKAVESCPQYLAWSRQRNMPSRKGGRPDGYWTKPQELFARAFEAFVIVDAGAIRGFHGNRESQPQGAEAEYLASVIRPLFRKAVKSYTHRSPALDPSHKRKARR